MDNENQAQVSKVKKRSQLMAIWFRFKKNKLALIGMVILVALMLVAVFADIIVNYEEMAVAQHMDERLLSPGENGHLLGTDRFGRDLFARIIHGSRISIFLGLISIALSLALGSILGSSAAYYGGRVDTIIMRIMDVFMAIPSILLSISVVAALGPGLINILIAMSISSVPRFSRIVRSSILTIMGQEFIEAAKACGTKDSRIILRHIIPNAIGPIIVQATLSMAGTILAISSLAFVGLGIASPTPEWGAMLSEAREQMRNYPYLIVTPGIAIVITVVSLNLIGDGLRDALDPRLRN